jgi:hypothetical protein
MAYETIEVPRTPFIGWGNREGQYVEGIVVDYDPVGGNDFNSNECPLLEIELVKPAASFNKEGDRTDYKPGDTVSVTCGQANLKKAVRKGNPKPGNMILIKLAGKEKSTQGHTVKIFLVQVDRSQSNASNSKASAAAAEPPDNDPWGSAPPADAFGGGGSDFGGGDDEPPF